MKQPQQLILKHAFHETKHEEVYIPIIILKINA